MLMLSAFDFSAPSKYRSATLRDFRWHRPTTQLSSPFVYVMPPHPGYARQIRTHSRPSLATRTTGEFVVLSKRSSPMMDVSFTGGNPVCRVRRADGGRAQHSW